MVADVDAEGAAGLDFEEEEAEVEVVVLIGLEEDEELADAFSGGSPLARESKEVP